MVANIGVQVAASAQPYKLLLYEEGAFFKAHRDTEKVSGMFGTLVVCLPSEHTGGEVHLKHNQNQRLLSTAEFSAHDLSALAWYFDVQHEIKPVLSGYRLVLTYNLVQDQAAPKQTAAGQDANHEKLKKLLEMWKRRFHYQDHFVYPLSFKYTKDGLCQSSLKSGDAAKGRYLDQVSAAEGVYWFLGHTVKQKEGSDWYGDGADGSFNDHSFTWTTSPNGRRIELFLRSVKEDALLIEEEWYDRDADSEDEGEEYTGNESTPTMLRYHDSVIVLMSKDAVLSKLRAVSRHSPESLSSYFDLVCADPIADQQRLREALSVILSQAVSLTRQAQQLSYWTLIHGYPYHKEDSKHTEHVKLFETVAGFCYQNGLGDIVVQIARTAMKDSNWTSSPELAVRLVVFELDNGRSEAWDQWYVLGIVNCEY